MNTLSRYLLAVLMAVLLTQCSKEDDDVVQPGNETVTDIDGNVYHTVIIGDQTWMVENLKTTKCNDGTPIDEYTSGNNWNAPGVRYQWADTDDLNNLYPEPLPEDFYGAMYNEAALSSGKLAPIGWRIPSEQDFIELEDFIASDGQLDMEAIALKATNGWVPSIGNGTDLYDFNALPNGYVTSTGTATGAQAIASWATTEVDTVNNTRRIANIFDQDTILYFDNSTLLGAGVRCIKE